MLRKGFTLIELLIVITIIAILAGAAIPYVQDYVEDARLSKVRSDLDEIKNALIRWELDTGRTWDPLDTRLTKLVGPYLTKALADPWGSPYYIDANSAVVVSYGPDRKCSLDGGAAPADDADDIFVDFRPPLALTKAYYIDANKNGLIDNTDQIKLRFTRPVANVTGDETDFGVLVDGGAAAPFTGATVVVSANDAREVLLTIDDITGVDFKPGRDSIQANATVVDATAYPTTLPTLPAPSLNNEVVIKAL